MAPKQAKGKGKAVKKDNPAASGPGASKVTKVHIEGQIQTRFRLGQSSQAPPAAQAAPGTVAPAASIAAQGDVGQSTPVTPPRRTRSAATKVRVVDERDSEESDSGQQPTQGRGRNVTFGTRLTAVESSPEASELEYASSPQQTPPQMPPPTPPEGSPLPWHLEADDHDDPPVAAMPTRWAQQLMASTPRRFPRLPAHGPHSPLRRSISPSPSRRNTARSRQQSSRQSSEQPTASQPSSRQTSRHPGQQSSRPSSRQASRHPGQQSSQPSSRQTSRHPGQQSSQPSSRQTSRHPSRHTSPHPSSQADSQPPSGSEEPSKTQRGRTGHKSSTNDVYKFATLKDGLYHCSFCLSMWNEEKQNCGDSPTWKPTCFRVKTGTDNYRRHYATNHAEEWVNACDKNGFEIHVGSNAKVRAAVQGVRERRGVFPEGVPQYSKDAFADALVELFCADDFSFNKIESPRLRRIFLMLRESLQDTDIPHRQALRDRALRMWEDNISTLAGEMEKALGKVSLTSDVWSDPNLRAFMAVTAHWIAQYTVQTASGKHTGKHLAEAMYYVLKRVGILDKLGCITMDNAYNNDTMIESLAEKLESEGFEFGLCNRIRCFAHIVNLVCQAILKVLEDGEVQFEGTFRDIVKALRELIAEIRRTSQRRDQFSTIVKSKRQEGDLQLLQDVRIRWSSTFLMIDRALDLRTSIEKFIKDRRDENDLIGWITDEEWKGLENLMRILEIPDAFQQVLSMEKTPVLSDTLLAFEGMLEALEAIIVEPEFSDVEDMIQAGIDKLKDYQGRTHFSEVPAYTLAILLHPMIKLSWHMDHRTNEEVREVKEFFIQQLHDISAKEPSRTEPQTVPQPTQPSRKQNPKDILQLRSRPQAQTGSGSGQPRSVEDEANSYFNEYFDGEIDALTYWQENRNKYPTIFKLAMDILPIQGTSVPCERIFSSAKETTTPRRNRLAPDTMEACQMIKHAARSADGMDLNFTSWLSTETVLEEMEVDDMYYTYVPEELAEYRLLADRTRVNANDVNL